jgi:hypothetical protein
MTCRNWKREMYNIKNESEFVQCLVLLKWLLVYIHDLNDSS